MQSPTVTVNDMAQGYIEQCRQRAMEMEQQSASILAQIDAVNEHIAECEERMVKEDVPPVSEDRMIKTED